MSNQHQQQQQQQQVVSSSSSTSTTTKVKPPLQIPVIKYPVTDKKLWGSKYWFYLHENASLYPDTPSEEDKQKERQHIEYFLNTLPCEKPCGINARAYAEKNPPNLNSRNEYFAWTVNFHNKVNEETGKSARYSPEDLLRTKEEIDTEYDDRDIAKAAHYQECEDCNIPPKPKQKVDLSHSMESYKAAVKQLVNDVCMKEGVEPPEIFFTKCADGTDTSCMVNLTMPDGKTKKQVAFYHPKQLLDTILHEIDHHRDAKQGKTINDSLNPKANKYAEEMISKYFPFDRTEYTKDGNISLAHQHATATVIRESMPIPPPSQTANPQQMVQEVYNEPNQFGTEIEDPKILNEFPHLKQTLLEIKKEELKGEIREFENKGGVLSHLDRAYAWPAKLTGLKPEQLNQLHTPTILSQIIFTVSGTFLAPLPKRIIVGLLAIFLMLMGIGYHKRMAVRDIQLIQLMGAQLLWGSTITALNPKNARRLKKDFDRFAELAKSKNLHFKDIIETPDHDITGFHPGSGGKTVNAFSQSSQGRPIKQGVNPIDDSVNYAENPEFLRSFADDSVISLPKFTSRSHARFI